MNKLLYFLIVPLAMALAGCGHSETADMEADYAVTSEDVVQEFLDDETAAGQKYIDKVIEVTGPVMEINNADGKIIGIKLSTDEFSIVNCTFQETPESIPEGEVTIKGICSGFNGDPESMLPGGTVELNRAVITNNQ